MVSIWFFAFSFYSAVNFSCKQSLIFFFFISYMVLVFAVLIAQYKNFSR